MLATYNDANRYLDQAKVAFFTDDEATEDRTVAERYVLALLGDIYGDDIVQSWTNTSPIVAPATQVPQLVTEIVAILMAASKYAKAYSLETNIVTNNYGVVLKAQADDLLTKLRNREITLVDLTILGSEALVEDDFWPNDTTVWLNTINPERAFTMDMEF